MRPKKCRYIRNEPKVRFFKPQGIRLKELQVITLTEEELEALRLVEIENMEQEQSAALMRVSRPTFSRILNKARKIVAQALVEGFALEIKGGTNAYISSINKKTDNSKE